MELGLTHHNRRLSNAREVLAKVVQPPPAVGEAVESDHIWLVIRVRVLHRHLLVEFVKRAREHILARQSIAGVGSSGADGDAAVLAGFVPNHVCVRCHIRVRSLEDV